MGLSIRIFIVEEDDTIKRFPLARYERLHKCDPDDALIVVDLVNRRPIEIVKDEYGFLFFDDEGRLKVSEHGKEENLAFDMIPPLLSDQTNNQVIDARHKFAKKSYFDKFSWAPTDEIIAAVAEAIFGKLI